MTTTTTNCALPTARRDLRLTRDYTFVGADTAAPVNHMHWTLSDLVVLQTIQIQTHQRDPRSVAAILRATAEARELDMNFVLQHMASPAVLNKRDLSIGCLAATTSTPLLALIQDAIHDMARSNGNDYPDATIEQLTNWSGDLYAHVPAVSDFESALKQGRSATSTLCHEAGWGMRRRPGSNNDTMVMGRYQIRIRWPRDGYGAPESIQIIYLDHGKIEVPILAVKGDAGGLIAAARLARLIHQSVLAFIAYHARLGVCTPATLDSPAGVVISSAPIYGNQVVEVSGWFARVSNGVVTVGGKHDSLLVLATSEASCWQGMLQACGAILATHGNEIRESMLINGIDHGPRSLVPHYEGFDAVPPLLLEDDTVTHREDGWWVTIKLPSIKRAWGPFPHDAIDLVVNFALSNR